MGASGICTLLTASGSIQEQQEKATEENIALQTPMYQITELKTVNNAL